MNMVVDFFRKYSCLGIGLIYDLVYFILILRRWFILSYNICVFFVFYRFMKVVGSIVDVVIW